MSATHWGNQVARDDTLYQRGFARRTCRVASARRPLLEHSRRPYENRVARRLQKDYSAHTGTGVTHVPRLTVTYVPVHTAPRKPSRAGGHIQPGRDRAPSCRSLRRQQLVIDPALLAHRLGDQSPAHRVVEHHAPGAETETRFQRREHGQHAQHYPRCGYAVGYEVER